MNKIDIDYIIKTVELASTEIMKIYNHFNVIEYKYKISLVVYFRNIMKKYNSNSK